MVWQLKNESAIMRRRSLGLTEDELAERLQDADFREEFGLQYIDCLLYTSPSPRDGLLSRMPSSA